ncbi:YigZ family protein [Carnobacterium pleistocenium]|uniref:YigZ family protein n=1 Tax=Carnobacterium pleistocenium TaxID=181073 RepID=UPI00054EC68D|nr:YigZ family protein [Carnobacterium pleistocenium]
MLNHYYTIKQDGQFELEIKKSRFICHLKRVTSEIEAQNFIQVIKKEHGKANHNCVAYLIGDHDEIQRAYDDGEPSGTAGVPMLEVLKKRQLKNVVAVVTRYFGGTKLGAGGLIRAYGKTVSQGLNDCGIVERRLHTQISVVVAYPASGKLENSLREANYLIKDILYSDVVSFVCLIDQVQLNQFQTTIIEWLNGQVSFKIGKDAYCDKDISN